MIVDASALLAILLEEPDARDLTATIVESTSARISVINFLEVAIRIDQMNSIVAAQAFDAFMIASKMSIEPVSPTQGQIARRAYVRFGKGRHPAALNLGDVFAYALSVERDEPLLFKGKDFSLTDVRRAALNAKKQ
jgi:ribonuclease VapC